jgi:hypothetical protein
MTQKRKIIKGTIEEKGRFLIDLGDNESDWWEGQIWKEKGCSANELGPYKRNGRDSRGDFFGIGVQNYEWFRQGWCKSTEIFLDEYYTFEEAKDRCELGYKD